GYCSTSTSPHTYSTLRAASSTTTLRDESLCTTSQSVTLVNPPAPSLPPSNPTLRCSDLPTGTITATFSGGTGTLQLQIDGAGYNTFTSPHTFTGLASGSHTVIVRDANLCTLSQSSTLTQPAALSLSLTETDASCSSTTDGTVVATFSGGTGTLQIQIDGGAFTTFTSPHTFSSQSAGSHTVTLRDANLCTSSQSITVGAPAAPSLSLTATDATCAGVSNGSVTATFSGGVGAMSTIFSQDFSSSSTLPSYIATPA